MALIPKAVRIRTPDGWQDIAITGPPGSTGPAGADGAKWHTGDYTPGLDDGDIGDFWLVTDSGDYFEKVSETVPGPYWSFRGNLVIEWIFGTGPPDDLGGEDGDFYLENNGRVWNKQLGEWVYTGIDLSGPAGSLVNTIELNPDPSFENASWPTGSGGMIDSTFATSFAVTEVNAKSGARVCEIFNSESNPELYLLRPNVPVTAGLRYYFECKL